MDNLTPKARPTRERGRKVPRSMAYQRAMADLRARHRNEFDQLYDWHLGHLGSQRQGEVAA